MKCTHMHVPADIIYTSNAHTTTHNIHQGMCSVAVSVAQTFVLSVCGRLNSTRIPQWCHGMRPACTTGALLSLSFCCLRWTLLILNPRFSMPAQLKTLLTELSLEQSTSACWLTLIWRLSSLSSHKHRSETLLCCLLRSSRPRSQSQWDSVYVLATWGARCDVDGFTGVCCLCRVSASPQVFRQVPQA